MQVNPFVTPIDVVVDDIMDITLEPHVCPHMITNASAP
jgi:hypothetical protein